MVSAFSPEKKNLKKTKFKIKFEDSFIRLMVFVFSQTLKILYKSPNLTK